MTFKDVRWRAEYVGFRMVGCLFEILPPRLIARLSQTLAWVFVRILPHRLTRSHVAAENIRIAFPEYSEAQVADLIEQMWTHLFRLVSEMIQFPRKLRLENCREVIVFRNRKAAVEALNSGRPVFLLGGHFGNWEASTATFGVFGFKMGVVARRLDNPYLHQWFVAAREQGGHKLLLKSGGFDGMVDLLQMGGNLGLLCDQDAGKRGVFVNFFGRPASTFRSIALLAREYNALVVVGYGRRLKDDFENCRWVRYEVGCEAVIDAAQVDARDEVQDLTERFTSALEQAIRRSPEQYFWVHRRWKSEPPRRKSFAQPERKAG
ncbi:lysophospholipid acyltransferase family protein [Planctomicrobium sp. SH664]|uniref:lysophospholipid acyltransferase family protein n=1 Tax=Planctomicrobium sp. SH664 TaxID=3448125 RepID=UPI003F5AE260